MVSVTTLAALVVDGLARGLFFALLGVGITLVFGLGGVLNLAIGTFALVAVVVTAELTPLGLVPAAVVGVAFVGVLALAVDRSLLSLVYRSEGDERVLLGIFVTLGLTILLDNVVTNLYPRARYSINAELGTVALGGVRLTAPSLVLIGVAAVLLAALFLFLDYTFVGKATRTVFQDETGALLVGVDPRKMRTLVFVLSSMVAATAGVVFALGTPITVTDSFRFTSFGLIVSIVGGVRNLRGAVVAGLLLGQVVAVADFYIGGFVASMVLFAVAVAVILSRPEVLE